MEVAEFWKDVVGRKIESLGGGELMMGLDAGTRVAGYCHVRKHDDGQRNRSLTVNSSLRLIPNPLPSVLCLVTQRSELREESRRKRVGI